MTDNKLPVTQADELLPCPNPWCEALEREGDYSPAVRLHHFGNYRVVCPSCILEGPLRPTEAEAIAAWHTRTDAPHPSEDVDSLLDDEAAALRIIDKAFTAAGISKRPFFGEAYEPGAVIRSIVQQVSARPRTDAQAELVEWEPIESAPKDGREALVGCWVEFEQEGTADSFWSQWITIFDGGPLGCDGVNGDPPTHWRPPPDPPAKYRAPNSEGGGR